jgi:hypothetical protein
VRTTWAKHLTEANFVQAILSLITLLNVSSSPLRRFTIYANLNTELMMAAHRWAHMHPHHVPLPVKLLQGAGVLISTTHHSRHHVSYKENFAIFTGWSNPSLNYAVQHWRSPYDTAWIMLFGLCMLLPLPVSLVAGCWGRKTHGAKNNPYRNEGEMSKPISWCRCVHVCRRFGCRGAASMAFYGAGAGLLVVVQLMQRRHDQTAAALAAAATLADSR